MREYRQRMAKDKKDEVKEKNRVQQILSRPKWSIARKKVEQEKTKGRLRKYKERCKTGDGDEQKTPMKVFNSAQTHGKMTRHCRTVREQKGQLSNALFAVLGLLQLQLSPLVATVESAKMMMIRSCHSIIATMCQDSYPDAKTSKLFVTKLASTGCRKRP